MSAELPKTTEHVVDPSKSSLTEEMIGPLEKRGDYIFHSENGVRLDIYTDPKSGEKFIKIDAHKKPQSQKLVALILKGVVNVSDIIRVGDSYYSHVHKLENIGSSEYDNVLSEAEADRFILSEIVGDVDHTVLVETKNDHDGYEILEDGQNLRVDVVNRKVNFFDFSENDLVSLSSHQYDEASLRKTFERCIKFFIPGVNVDEAIVLKVIKRKVTLLFGLYRDMNFDNFKKMIKKSGMKLTEDEQQILFKNIKLRIRVLNEVLSE